MATQLGCIFDGETDGPKGPNVVHRVYVPASWLSEGATVTIDLPRLLACAECQGGGCDTCGRTGAFAVRALGEPTEPLEVSFGPAPGGATTIELRIPGRGAADPKAEHPHGFLRLMLTAGEVRDSSVTRVETNSSLAQYRERELGFPMKQRMQAIALLGLVLCVAFVLILKLARLI